MISYIAIKVCIMLILTGYDPFESELWLRIPEAFGIRDIQYNANRAMSEVRALTWEALLFAAPQISEVSASVEIDSPEFEKVQIRLPLLSDGSYTEWTPKLHDEVNASCEKGAQDLAELLRQSLATIQGSQA